MKRIIIIILLSGLTYSTWSQEIQEAQKVEEASVEKSMFGIQVGRSRISMYNESRLSNRFALRTEVALWGGVSWTKGEFLSSIQLYMSPTFTLEPRYYYNLKKRQDKSLGIGGNSGNYFSIRTSFRPEWQKNGSGVNFYVNREISFIPSWGFRRNIGKKFSVESSVGIGYRRTFSNSLGSSLSSGRLALDFQLKLGYRFIKPERSTKPKKR